VGGPEEEVEGRMWLLTLQMSAVDISMGRGGLGCRVEAEGTEGG